MAIYLAGTESDVLSPSLGWTTTAGRFDSRFSRAAAIVDYNNGATATLDTGFGANSSTGYWVKWQIYPTLTNSSATYGQQQFLRVLDDSANLSTYAYLSSGTMYIRVYESGNTYAAAAGVNYPINGLSELAVHCYTESSVAYAELYLNGTLIAQASISGTNRGFGSVFLYNGDGNYGSSADGYVSELVVADEDPRGMRVLTLVPTGAGDEVDFSGAYTDIDEISVDGSAISSSTTADVSTFTHAGGITDGASIRAFVLGMVAAADTGNDLEGVVRVGSTNYSTALEQALTTGGKKNAAIFDVNPASSQAWTGAAINAMQFGVKNTS